MKKFAIYVAAPAAVFLLLVTLLVIASGTVWQHSPPDPMLPERLGQEISPEGRGSISASRIEMNVVVPVAAVQ
jgi:hypothetical protein